MNLLIIFITSFLILSGLGTIMHFTHDWFKKGILLHIFSALNESTWEHMKLLVAPTILVGLIQYIYLKNEYQNLISAILVLLVIELLTMPFIYESLKFLVKKVPFMITIAIFFLSIIFGLIAEYIVLVKGFTFIPESISLFLIALIVFLFGLFSYFPPKIPLFRDPVTGKYGDYKGE